MAKKTDTVSKPSSNELFIGIVRALGTNLSPTINQITYLLSSECGYRVEHVKLSTLFASVPSLQTKLSKRNKYEFYKSHMDAGNELRNISKDFVALLGIASIRELRSKNVLKTDEVGGARVAWIIDSLMHPDEVAAFRAVYGEQFILLGIYEELESRIGNLSEKLSASALSDNLDLETIVGELLARDRGEGAVGSSLNIEKTFFLADVFVDVADPLSSRQVPEVIDSNANEIKKAKPSKPGGLTNWTVRRLFEMIFGARNLTPTRHEVAMAHATIAAASSGSLARRVGAALVNIDGEIVATGYNDVPAIGGGLYPVYDWGLGKVIDNRDHVFMPNVPSSKGAMPGYGYDSNDLVKFEIFADLFSRLQDLGIIRKKLDPWKVLTESSELKKSQFFDVLEYGRSVHAEMAALTSAARSGTSPEGHDIYVTTFPCHECARHIIAAGIRKVIYLEPYPKSRVAALHHDAVSLKREKPSTEDRIRRRTEFLPFIGMAPSRFLTMNSWLERKFSFGDRDGGFPPGRAKNQGESSVLSRTARPRWSQTDSYYDVFSPSKVELGEFGVVDLLNKAYEKLREMT